jgi:hypothetical protein
MVAKPECTCVNGGGDKSTSNSVAIAHITAVTGLFLCLHAKVLVAICYNMLE